MEKTFYIVVKTVSILKFYSLESQQNTLCYLFIRN